MKNYFPYRSRFNLPVTLRIDDEDFSFAVSKPYPLPITKDAQGETIEFGNSLIINLLWADITDVEKEFFGSPCKSISFYHEELLNVVMLDFEFEADHIKACVVASEDSVRGWARQEPRLVEEAYFFLTEAKNHIIQDMRVLHIPMQFIHQLQASLIHYTKPNVEILKRLATDPYFHKFLKTPDCTWIYPLEDQMFMEFCTDPNA